MRIDRLDLIRYGKFTDRVLSFPGSPADFHLVVGPNEAGKSTVRSAILDLLFGIPTRTPLNFLHPHSEMRLGAALSGDGATLEFHRAKAQRRTLRAPDDTVLDDAELARFLGGADRHFFDQMFGLDHTRLVEGGNSILSAENDVGQVLFQSAAGIASLGRVRDALEQEADTLWAPKKSATRAYYAAAAALDEANAALKQATVRTREWAQAHDRAEDARRSLEAANHRRRELERERARLERVRRLAPYLRELTAREAQLAALGAVVDMPADARATLENAERELALNARLLKQRTQELDEARAGLDGIRLDGDALALAEDIARLETLRLRYGGHPAEIERLDAELQAWEADVERLRAQLGWRAPADGGLPGMPALPARRELDRLARAAGAIAQSLETAREALRSRQDEIETLQAQLADLPAGDVPPALRAALQHARSLGDSDALAARLRAAVERAREAAAAALRGLAAGPARVDELEAMPVPDPGAVDGLRQERQELASECRTARQRLDELRRTAAQAELAAAQFQALHQPVTQEELSRAREARDRLWSGIRSGQAEPRQAADRFEALVRDADRLADRRLERAEAAAELQSRQHESQRHRQAVELQEERLAALEAELERFDRAWDERAARLGLPGLALDAMRAWLDRREQALREARALAAAELERDQALQSAQAARQALSDALRAAGIGHAEDEGLAALSLRAERHIRAADGALVRRDTLSAQLLADRAQLDVQRRSLEEAGERRERWAQSWREALSACGLPEASSPASASGALELMAAIDEKLARIAAQRTERLDVMRAELAEFRREAARLAAALAPDLAGQEPERISLALAARLAQARDAQEAAGRLAAAVRAAEAHARQARDGVQAAHAAMQPLMARAGVASTDELTQIITASDRHRILAGSITEALEKLLEDGDGLDRAGIEAEVQACDLTGLPAALDKINDELAQMQERQNSLATELAGAQNQLAAISGADAAVQAEARRQEALAQMADAAERYIRLQAASRLLRWSIDRYREQKQGPMLGRAGEIFSRLTLGSFQRLVVDFEQEPMALQGQRDDGRLVPVSGMSDGTRDQLYLALRLAALELHLDHAAPLPLVADDLFINYDDARARAGLEVLAELSRRTQVIFLSHHDSIVPAVRAVLGETANVVELRH